jgi:hypothetical protein
VRGQLLGCIFQKLKGQRWDKSRKVTQQIRPQLDASRSEQTEKCEQKNQQWKEGY